jgi:hypothetical protein
MRAIIFSLVGFLALTVAGKAQATYLVSINTAPLIGHPAGPFSLAFQLGDGSGVGDGNNAAVLTDFTFGAGGSSSGTPQVVGGASGSLDSTVVLTDSGLVNSFAQTFTPGATLTFMLTLSTNLESGSVPDEFVFSILDNTGTPIPTQQGSLLNVFLAIYIASANPSIQTFASDPTRPPAGGGSPVTITPQINVQVPVTPMSFAVYATGMGCGALSFSATAYTDSFNSSLGSYDDTKQLSNGNVGVSGNANLSGSATINGAISTLSASTGNCQNGAPGITLSGKANATGGYAQLSIAPSYPNPVPGATGSQNYNFTSNATLPPGNYNNITVSGGSRLTFSAGTYNINSINLSGGSVLAVGSPGQVIVNVAGSNVSTPISLGGGSIVNPFGVPGNLLLIYGGNQPIVLSGGPASYASLYAPNSPVSLSGGSGWYGAMVVQTLNDSGGSPIHYDSNPAP